MTIPATLDHLVASYDVKKRKGTEALRVKPLWPIRAIDALTGDAEQTGNKRKNLLKRRPFDA